MRVKSLDSLRGIAALVVVFHHCALTYFPHGLPGLLRAWPARLFIAGNGAVLVFFALSGFILFLALERDGAFRCRAYLIKRVVRLYLPFLAAIAGSALLYGVTAPHAIPALGHWFNAYSWNAPPKPALIAAHLAMTDRPQFETLDNVMWSLGYEIRISSFLVDRPMRVEELARDLPRGDAPAAAASYLTRGNTVDWLYDPHGTMQTLFLFVGGAGISRNATFVCQRIVAAPFWMRVGLCIVGLTFITFPRDSRLRLVVNFAVLLLVALALADPAAGRILTHRATLWLGRISFSLYSWHLIVLFTLVHLLFGKVPSPAILGLTIVVSLVVADLAHRTIEKPAIDLGRKLASPFSSARGTARSAARP